MIAESIIVYIHIHCDLYYEHVLLFGCRHVILKIAALIMKERLYINQFFDYTAKPIWRRHKNMQKFFFISYFAFT